MPRHVTHQVSIAELEERTRKGLLADTFGARTRSKDYRRRTFASSDDMVCRLLCTKRSRQRGCDSALATRKHSPTAALFALRG